METLRCAVDVRREIVFKEIDVATAELNEYMEPGCGQRIGSVLKFACPGCGRWGRISVGSPKPAESPSWQIVLENPLTLAPSINCVGCCGWHGYLVKGRFQMNPE